MRGVFAKVRRNQAVVIGYPKQRTVVAKTHKPRPVGHDGKQSVLPRETPVGRVVLVGPPQIAIERKSNYRCVLSVHVPCPPNYNWVARLWNSPRSDAA